MENRKDHTAKKTLLETVQAQNQGLNRRVAELQKELDTERSEKIRLKNDKGPLSRSSHEAYIGIAIAIVLGVYPVTWWLRIPLFVILGVICSDYCWRSPFSYRFHWAAKLALVLVVLGLLTNAARVNVSKAYHDDLFPSNVQYMTRWGEVPGEGYVIKYADQNGNGGSMVGNLSAQVIIDGTKLQRFSKKYRIWAVCFHHAGLVDLLDEPVSSGNLFDIQDDAITMKIPWSLQFQQEVIRHQVGTVYAVVLVPKKIDNSHFSTMRDAVNRGGVVLESNVGPP